MRISHILFVPPYICCSERFPLTEFLKLCLSKGRPPPLHVRPQAQETALYRLKIVLWYGLKPASGGLPLSTPRVAKKLKLQERRAVIPSRRSLAACRPLGFLGRSMEPFADRRTNGGDSWSGHVSWPTSRGRWTRSCYCGMSIWLLKTGS